MYVSNIRRKSFATATFVAMIFLILEMWILWLDEAWHRSADRRHDESIMTREITSVRSALESSLNERLSLPIALKAFVVSKPDFTEAEFDKFAAGLTATVPGIMSLQLAPNAIVRYATNKEKNQKAIGHDLLKDAVRRPAVLRAIEEQSFVVAGPVDLIQGGQALIARLPIFIEGHQSERGLGHFWGFASVLIDFTKLVESADTGENGKSVEIAIRGLDGLGSEGKVFYGAPKIFDAPAKTAEIVIPNGTWQVGGILRTANSSPEYRLSSIVSVTLSLILAGGLWFLVYRQGSADLIKAKNEAERASRLKTKFLAVMSHEMRNPLNGVLGVLDLLGQTRLDDRQKQYVDVATASGEILLRHINDVLDITKIESGQIRFDNNRFDVGQLIDDVIDISSPAAKENDTSVVGQIDLPVQFIEGDAHRIGQVLLNLVENATKFTRAGLITLTVNMVDGNGAGDVIEFAVEDTGIGISPEDRERIFADFVSLNTRYDRAVSGTGLGLSICKRLVEAMGGEIGVESGRTGGSRFWFRIPKRKVDDGLKNEEAAREKTFVSPATEPFPNLSGRVLDILIVEDNETNRMVARDMLEAAGHNVTEARDGGEAIEAAGAQSFDLILMDVSMPTVDGVAATQAIRSDSDLNRDTPIIGLTAHALKEEQQRFFEAGMQGCLIKPLRMETLNSALGISPSCERRSSENPEPFAGYADHIFLDGKTLDELATTLPTEALNRTISRVRAEIARETPTIIAASEGDWNELANAAHKLAGSVAIVGARRLYDVLAQIEVGSKSGDAKMVKTSCKQLSEAADGTLLELGNYSKAVS